MTLENRIKELIEIISQGEYSENDFDILECLLRIEAILMARV